MLSLLPIALLASLLQFSPAEAAYGGNPCKLKVAVFFELVPPSLPSFCRCSSPPLLSLFYALPDRQMAHRSIVNSPTTVDGKSFDFVIAG